MSLARSMVFSLGTDLDLCIVSHFRDLYSCLLSVIFICKPMSYFMCNQMKILFIISKVVTELNVSEMLATRL